MTVRIRPSISFLVVLFSRTSKPSIRACSGTFHETTLTNISVTDRVTDELTTLRIGFGLNDTTVFPLIENSVNELRFHQNAPVCNGTHR